jgi:hypothetical protein
VKLLSSRFTLNDPIWVGYLGTEAKNGFFGVLVVHISRLSTFKQQVFYDPSPCKIKNYFLVSRYQSEAGSIFFITGVRCGIPRWTRTLCLSSR